MVDHPVRAEEQVLGLVSRCFFEAVPLKYQTYCALTAQITQATLERFGITSELLPCQLWYAGPDRNHVVGFVGHPGKRDKWDGHVICATRKWFMDAAVKHLERDIGVRVPHVIAGERFDIPTQAIARFDASPTERIWWYHPPAGAGAPPREPAAMVSPFADALCERVRAQLAQG